MTCSDILYSPWTYRYVDTGCHSSQSVFRAICEIWYEGQWANGNDCLNSSPLTEDNMAQRSRNWATRSGVCSVSDHTVHPWLAPGQTLDTGWCAHGVVTVYYTNGIETTNWREIRTSGTRGTGCATSYNVQSIVRRDRSPTTNCPAGYTKRTMNNRAECVREQEESHCPSSEDRECEGADPGAPLGGPALEVGNPISPGLGSKRQTETDYAAAGTSPLRFVRSYHSNGHFRVPGDPEARTSSMGDYWRTNYDRYLYAIPESTYVMAIAIRPGGYIKHFDASGKEVASPTHSRERIERITDVNGAWTGWRYYSALDEVEVYDTRGRLLSITDRRGIVQTLTYSDASTPPSIARAPGLLVRVNDGLGRSLSFTYDDSRRITSVSDPAGNRYRYQYDSTGNLKLVQFPERDGVAPQRLYHYENATFKSALTGITDENSQRYATWTYDSLGRATSSEHAGGAGRHTLAFSGLSTTVTGPLGAAVTYQYTLNNGVRRNTGVVRNCASCGGSTSASTTYDANGFVSSRTDFNGRVTQYTHDARGLETRRTEAAGTAQERSITIAWHPSFRLPVEINEPGRRTEYSYDASGNRLSMTVTDMDTGESRTTAYSYTPQGLLASIDGPRTDVADITSFAYDSQGNLTSITNALGHITRITAHDAHGNPLTIVDPNGVETTLTYDARQRLLSRSVAGAVTAFEYDGVGNLTRLTLPSGAFLAYTYDAAYRLTGIRDSLGNRIHYTLDAAGNRTKEEVFDLANVLRRQLQQEYDQLGRLKKVLGANGQVTEFDYDAQGNRTSQTEANSFTTQTQYDALDRVLKVTDAANGETAYGYDALDQLTSVTDPKGLSTTYTRNAFGEVTQQASPDTGTTAYAYDAAGNRIRQTDARGITVTYAYDALNRLTAVDYPGTAEDVAYFYDGSNYGGTSGIPAGTAHATGRLTGIRDPSGSQAYRYTARGEVSERMSVIRNVIYRLRYEYDPDGRLVQMTYPNGRVVSYEHDAGGNVRRITTELAGHSQALAEDIGYLPFGPASHKRLGNGVAEITDYDLDYRVSRIQASGLLERGYYYDARNNIEAIEDGLDSSRGQLFDYDPLGRLSRAQGVYGALAWTYDPVGNRLSETRNGETSHYRYASDRHHLASIESGKNKIAFAYDAAGNTLSKARQRFTYNQAGRMESATGKPNTGHVYNARGQRVIKTTGNRATVYH
ncbi:MAG TPA: DUF6531 domain-containing protein, partial [Nevskiales bacterium]|nr:DUF6531 domain-containing protein [Nevskiales bacterium]